MNIIVVLCVWTAKDADEKEKWIIALENAISRQDLNQVIDLNEVANFGLFKIWNSSHKIWFIFEIRMHWMVEDGWMEDS